MKNVLFVVRYDFSVEEVYTSNPSEWDGECIGYYDTLEEAEHSARLAALHEYEESLN
jgi:hypothetical protein